MGFWNRVKQVFTLDTRSLSLFRIFIASVVLYDLADRVGDLEAHYTDMGVLPARTLITLYGDRMYASLHVVASGSYAAVALLFAVHALAAVALLLGFHTRLATLACWFLALSLQVRTVALLKMGGDSYVAVALLFALFLPIGRHWSWDSRRGTDHPPLAANVISLATVAFVAQVCIFYWQTGWIKTGETWFNGTAVWYLVNLDMLRSPIAPWIATQYWAMAPLTHATHALERFGPVLFLIPFYAPFFRSVAIVSFTMLHIGIGAFMYLGAFPAMSMAPLAALVPSKVWDAWLPRLMRRPFSVNAQPPLMDRQASKPVRWITNLAVVVLTLHILSFCIATLGIGGLQPDSLPGAQLKAGRALGLNNTWSMMSPNPGNLNWWFLIDGRTASRHHVDPFSKKATTWDRPENNVDSLRSWRWRLTLLGLLTLPENSPRRAILQGALGDYFCRQWNSEHAPEDRLISGRYARVVEPIGLTKRMPTFREWIGEFTCPTKLAPVHD